MRFAVVGEGLTDYIVLKNLLIGFFHDKDLQSTRLLPMDKEPVGWGNVLKYLSTNEFKTGVENSEYVIVQIDTRECAEWNEGLNNIGDDIEKVKPFINEITKILIGKIGSAFYETNNEKILFAITVHEIECWLLPFNSNVKAHVSKMVSCSKSIEQIAQRKGFSTHQKHYKEGKNYDELSKDMRKNRTLMENYSFNVSLKIFIENLKVKFQINDIVT